MPKRSTPQADDVLLSDQAAADRLGVSLATIRRMRRDGDLSFVRVRNSVRTPMSELTRYIASRTVGGVL